MWDFFVALIVILVIIDLIRWAWDTSYSKPNFIEMIIVSIIANTLWSFFIVIFIKIIDWVFS